MNTHKRKAAFSGCEGFYTVKDLQKKLGCTKLTIYNYVEKGVNIPKEAIKKLAGKRGMLLFKKSVIDEWLAS